MKFPGVFAGAMLVLSSASADLAAQAFPNKPIRIIVPFAPGGSTDVVARRLAVGMETDLKQPLLVENLAATNGIIGANSVAKAKPDGHTVLLATTTVLTLNPLLYSNVPYTSASFDPIVVALRDSYYVLTHPSIPGTSISEFVAYAKANPKKINAGNTGMGSSTHLSSVLFQMVLGAQFVDVPYKGSALILNDLLGGQIQMFIGGGSSTSVNLAKAGKLRMLANTGAQRTPVSPDTPTMKEMGYPDLEIYNYNFLLSPAGTPKLLIDRLNKASTLALNMEPMKSSQISEGSSPGNTTPDQVKAIIVAEDAKWKAVVGKLGLKFDIN